MITQSNFELYKSEFEPSAKTNFGGVEPLYIRIISRHCNLNCKYLDQNLNISFNNYKFKLYKLSTLIKHL